MTPMAQEAVRAYFEEQELYYDIGSLLIDAYTDYVLCVAEEKISQFSSHVVSQDIGPAVETERF